MPGVVQFHLARMLRTRPQVSSDTPWTEGQISDAFAISIRQTSNCPLSVGHPISRTNVHGELSTITFVKVTA